MGLDITRNNVSGIAVKPLVFGIILLMFAATWPLALVAEVRIQGSSTILPVIKKAGKVFHKKTGVSVYVTGGGSNIGIEATLSEKSDIGMVSRDLYENEARHLDIHTIAYDGIAVITNTKNPVNNLTKNQVVEIFNGTINNWKQLGWNEKQIITIHKREGRSTKSLFELYFDLEGKTDPSGLEIGSNAEAILFVAGDPWAIGYVSIGSSLHASSIGVNVKTIALNRIPASTENITNHSYPLRRPLNLVVNGKPSLETQMFLDFIKGDEGQAIIRSKRFVPAL